MVAPASICCAGAFSSWHDPREMRENHRTGSTPTPVATFRRTYKEAFEAVFVQVLLLARESGLLRLGTVSIDGTKIDTNASKIRSVRYDRTHELRAKLAADIAALTAKAEAADAQDKDPQALPAELAPL